MGVVLLVCGVGCTSSLSVFLVLHLSSSFEFLFFGSFVFSAIKFGWVFSPTYKCFLTDNFCIFFAYVFVRFFKFYLKIWKGSECRGLSGKFIFVVLIFLL